MKDGSNSTVTRLASRERRTAMVGFLILCTFTVGSPSAGLPIEWTLEEVAFHDGGSATGSFVYDASTNTYSDVDIETTVGFSNFAYSYHDASTVSISGELWSSTSLIVNGGLATTYPELRLNFSSPLTNAGGAIGIAVDPTSDTSCTSSGACSGETNREGATVSDFDFRWVTSGSVASSPVPEPAAPALMILGSAGWSFRRGAPCCGSTRSLRRCFRHPGDHWERKPIPLS